MDKNTNEYITSLYNTADRTDRQKFIAATEMKDFIPVVDDDVARLLKLLVRIFKPRNILEIGTSIGYAATSMALVAKEYGGRIITVEYDTKVAEQAEENFRRAGVSDYVHIEVGDAREIIPGMNGKFDLIFQDVDKRLYPVLLEDCIRILAPGGILVAEDTLFPVIELHPKWHDLIPPIEEFNRLIATDKRLESTILPIGDGVTVAVKRSE